MDKEALSVIDEVAGNLGVANSRWGETYITDLLPRADGNGYSMRYRDLKKEREFVFHPSLRGAFQRDNMALALNVAQELGLSDAACVKGVEGVYWPARFEKIKVADSFVIFDCAHNSDGFHALVESLEFEGLRDLCVGFGCLESKNWQEMIKILMPYVNEWNLLLPQSTRAVPNEVVADYLSCLGIRTYDYKTDYERFLRERAGREPLLIAGSMYMVGGLRALLVEEEKALWEKELRGVGDAPTKNTRISVDC